MCVWLLNADDSRLRRYASASVIDETAVWETRCRHQSASAFRHEFAVSGSPHESDALIVGNVGSGVDWFSLGPVDAVQFLSELLPSWPLRFPIRVELIGIIVSGISARGWNGPNELRRGFGIHCGSSAGCRLAKALDYGWRGGYVANWLCPAGPMFFTEVTVGSLHHCRRRMSNCSTTLSSSPSTSLKRRRSSSWRTGSRQAPLAGNIVCSCRSSKIRTAALSWSGKMLMLSSSITSTSPVSRHTVE